MAGVWTKNWTNLKRSWALGMFSQDVGDVFNISGSRLVTGAGYLNVQYGDMARPLAPITGSMNPSANQLAVRIGTSDTAAADTDYNLGEAFTSGLSYVAVTNGNKSYNPSTGIATVDASVTIQNTAAAAKIVREWGLFSQVYYNGQNPTNGSVLLYRSVLDTPITLNQYETITISFTRGMRLDIPQI